MAKPEPKRISQLDLADPLTGAERLAITQNERTVSSTLATLKDYTDTSCQCTLVSRYVDSCTSAVTFEEYLHTYTLPANTLSTNGSYLDVYVWGVFEATATTKTVTLRFGSTLVTLPVATYNDRAFELKVKIQRNSATSQRITGFWQVTTTTGALSNADTLSVFTEPTENLLTDISMSVSGTNGSANAEDICIGSWIVDLHKLDADS